MEGLPHLKADFSAEKLAVVDLRVKVTFRPANLTLYLFILFNPDDRRSHDPLSL